MNVHGMKLNKSNLLCVNYSLGSLLTHVLFLSASFQFFFILQRSVRPNGPLTYLEKQALVAVACIVPYTIFVSIFTEGESNKRKCYS